jgi:hypothetical protein
MGLSHGIKMYKSFFMVFFATLFFITTVPAHGIEGDKDLFRAVIGDDGIQRVDIVGGEYFFKPNHIIVKIHVPVELRVHKESRIIPHNIVIHEPDAGIQFRESFGTTPHVIRFTPGKTGKFSFHCDKRLLFFKSHREKGMEGVLEVIE